jgi:hypothetical protein
VIYEVRLHFGFPEAKAPRDIHASKRTSDISDVELDWIAPK